LKLTNRYFAMATSQQCCDEAMIARAGSALNTNLYA
jgi:hypothetical protein